MQRIVQLTSQTVSFAVLFAALLSCQAHNDQASSPFPVAYRTTVDQTKWLAPDTLTISATDATTQDVAIKLDPGTEYQRMDGFGFTLNGGSAMHLQRMSEPARNTILAELFDPQGDGIRVNYLRISVGGSDLDEYPWSYSDLAPGATDEALSSFSLGYDTLYLIPTLQEILKLNPDLKLMGSPWSPPAWMKDNQDTRGGSLLPKYYPAYAAYFVKYIKGMEAAGIPIDAITVQNEPLHPGNNPSLLMLAEDQAIFVRDHLGPAFVKNDIKTKIIIYDHNADRPDYPISIMNDTVAAKYIDGSAFHLYGGTIDALSSVHEAHPDKHLYFTEQWIGAPGDFAGDFSWHTENLIIGAPRNWCKTVLEWNLAADENQDPHTDRGGCDRCLGAITIVGDTITRNPAYYIVGQASRFIPAGSVRIGSDIIPGTTNVAYRTPAGETVIVVQNLEDEATEVRFEHGRASVTLGMEAKEVVTLVWP